MKTGLLYGNHLSSCVSSNVSVFVPKDTRSLVSPEPNALSGEPLRYCKHCSCCRHGRPRSYCLRDLTFISAITDNRWSLPKRDSKASVRFALPLAAPPLRLLPPRRPAHTPSMISEVSACGSRLRRRSSRDPKSADRICLSPSRRNENSGHMLW